MRLAGAGDTVCTGKGIANLQTELTGGRRTDNGLHRSLPEVPV